uniref:Carbohydrate kinase FGGY N-terminal domain-containing protein n=1 Tax=Timema tahoe TaxID=61484 RepID=A0A7R9FLV2_9NEOP|nr:unnamed protein product [Timema tahoe]
MEGNYVMALDVGTTTIRCHLIDKSTYVIGMASDQVELLYPETGREEIDPEKLWTTVLKVVRAAVQIATSKIEELEKERYNHFVSPVLILGSKSIFDPIKKINLPLFKTTPTKKKCKLQQNFRYPVRDTVGPLALDGLDIHQPIQVLGLYGEYPIATPEPKLSFLKVNRHWSPRTARCVDPCYTKAKLANSLARHAGPFTGHAGAYTDHAAPHTLDTLAHTLSMLSTTVHASPDTLVHTLITLLHKHWTRWLIH